MDDSELAGVDVRDHDEDLGIFSRVRWAGVHERRCQLKQQMLQPAGLSRYAERMATMFIVQSNEYIQQIEAEIERLEQLRDQVRATIQSEEELESETPQRQAPRKRAMKIAGKKAAGKKVAAKKRGRPAKSATPANA